MPVGGDQWIIEQRARHAGEPRSVVCATMHLVSAADRQTLRSPEGRFVLERAIEDNEVARDGGLLAVVHGPDGGLVCDARMLPKMAGWRCGMVTRRTRQTRPAW